MDKDPLEQTQTVTTEPDYDTLRDEAYAADDAEMRGEETPSAEPGAEVAEQPAEDRAPEQAEEKKQPDNPETSADKPRGPDGKFVKKDELAKAEPVKPAEPVQTESKYAKAKEREARAWQEIEKTKTETRQMRDEVAQLLQEIKTHREQPAQQPSQTGLNSKQLSSAAQEFKSRALKLMEEGDIDGAKQQLAYSDQAVAEANKVSVAESQQQEQKFVSQWQEQARAVIKEAPELGDPNSEVAKQMMQLLNEHPLLGFVPDGFRKAHEILTLRRDAAEVSGLREENTHLKAENERLTKLTTPAGGKDVAKHSSARSYTEMPLEELHKRLAREAEMADYAA